MARSIATPAQLVLNYSDSSVHPPGLDACRIEVYAVLPQDARRSTHNNDGLITHRYSIDGFTSLLRSTQENALYLRYMLRFATTSTTPSQTLGKCDDLLTQVQLACELGETEAIDLQRSALDAYIRAAQASAKALTVRHFVTSKLDAAKSVGHLLEFLFALQRRIPPPFSSLVWECEQRSLLPAASAVAEVVDLFSPNNLLSTLTRITDGDIAPQSIVFAAVEELALQHGLAEVLEQWTDQQRKNLRPIRHHPGKNGASDASTRKMVSFINRVHKLDYKLLHRLDGGWSAGAYLLQLNNDSSAVGSTELKTSGEAASNRAKCTAVLKWNTDKNWAQQVLQAGPIIARACAIGYPTPPWIAFGVSPSGYPYQVQAFATGSPVSTIDVELVESLLPIFDLQRNFHTETTAQNWTAHDLQLVFDSQKVHNRLAASTHQATRELHASLMEWVAPCATAAELTMNDLVHGDLNLTNILLDRGASHSSTEQPQPLALRVTLVDSEGLGHGSVLCDVATVLLTAFRQHATVAVERLLEYAVAHVRRPMDLHLALAARMLGVMAYIGDANQGAIAELQGLLEQVQARCCITH